MNTTTTILTGLAGVGGVTSTTVNKDGTIDRGKRNATLTVTIASTGTAFASDCIHKKTKEQVAEEYSQRYVESMSNEELVKALQDFDLLDRNSKEVPKTLKK